jgi:hypothetical protein
MAFACPAHANSVCRCKWLIVLRNLTSNTEVNDSVSDLPNVAHTLGGSVNHFLSRILAAGAAVSAAFVTLPIGGVQAASVDLACTAGSTGSTTFNAASGDTKTYSVSNAAGSTISFTATLTNSAGTGRLHQSGGSDILTFPSNLSAKISTELADPTWFVLEASGTDVTVSVVCNPGGAQSTSEAAGDSASSTSIVRQVTQETLRDLASQLLVTTQLHDANLASGEYTEQHRTAAFDFAVTFLGRDRSLVEGILSSSKGSDYALLLFLAAKYADEIYKSSLSSSRITYALFLNLMRVVESVENSFLRENPDIASRSAPVANASSAYFDFPSDSSAVAAINRAAGASKVVEGSFNVLGYGPNGGFSGDAVLGRGDNWVVGASVVGAISQADASAGGAKSVSGRGTINFVGALAPNLVAGLGLSIGATSEQGSFVDDAAYHYAANALVTHSLAPSLSMSGRVGYELTNHNYSRGTAKGDAFSHLFSAGLGIKGDVDMAAFMLTPTLDVDLVHERSDAVTLSDGTALTGFDRTTGKATVGGTVSRDYLWDTQTGFIVITPSVGADASLSLTGKTTTAGVSSSSVDYGLGLSAGVGFAYQSGLELSLSTRVVRSRDTLGASVRGTLSSLF